MHDTRSEGAARERRLVIQIVQVINLAFLAVDVARYGPRPTVVAGRLIVSAALLAASVALVRIAAAPRLRRALVAVVLALVGGFAVLAWGSGGADSPYLFFLAFVPIVLTIAIPDEPAVTLAAGLSATLVGVVFELAAREAGPRLGFVLVAYGSCTFYGTTSAALYRRMRRRERDAAAARADAIAELGRSEQRRLEAERLAAVGRLAAGFAHDVNNPLACASANLHFVREEAGRFAGDPELGAALDDALDALGRIRALVADLRVLATGDGGRVSEVDVAGVLDEALESVVRGDESLDVERHVPNALPPVRASAPHLAQVLRFLVTLLARDTERGAPGARGTVVVEAARAGDTVRVALAAGARARSDPDHPAVPATGGATVALCRELLERWGGTLASTESGWGEYVLTLRSADAQDPAEREASSVGPA